ncbi:glycosyltransferase family 1 protein [Helicobacter sp. 11S02596-1]|uniref:glycosyltransferase family 4 protein n=1 Tax=Helicobacter sp. 11S02596-1 TaxID=1476194 RepID=UPI000BA7DD87|nr:glycosyltransferase family 1 protein [Helicobacter sp. 11S02596-1]PAF42807.1 hypothetical protein BJI48_06005 [Helicobacter sp. 11S02596-1]
MKIIFDVSTLSDMVTKTSSRVGICLTTYNLLGEFLHYASCHDEIEILFYVDMRSDVAVKKYFQSSDVYKKIDNICMYSKLSQWVSWGFCWRFGFTPKNALEKFLAKSFTALLLLGQKIFAPFDKIVLDKEETYIFFSPRYKIPDIIKNHPHIIKFTLLHDTIPLELSEYFPQNKKQWFRELFDSLNSEDYYFANSICTRNDFLKHAPQINPSHFWVTYLAANKSFFPDVNNAKNQRIRQKYHIPPDKKYIFSLCSLEPRKNLLFVVENFIHFIRENAIDDVVFVLGGGHWEEFIGKLDRKIASLGDYRYKIIKAGYVDDEDLANLYAHSLCSVYLSIYEGFGLPALEAMACGAPLIASSTTSLPEVVGDGGLLVSPSDDIALREAFGKIYFDPEFAKALSMRGREQAKQFSWEKCAQEMIEKMQAVAGAGQGKKCEEKSEEESGKKECQKECEEKRGEKCEQKSGEKNSENSEKCEHKQEKKCH